MRVVKVVSNNAVPYDRRVWQEAVTLADAGHEVIVVCPREPRAPERRVTLEGVDVRRYWLPFEGTTAIGLVTEFAISLVLVSWTLLGIRRRHGPIDVLHVANPPETFWPLARLLQTRGTRFVFDHHDLSPEMFVAKGGRSGGVVHRVLMWLERRTVETADLIVSTNASYRDLVIERDGADPDKVVVVRSAPDTSRWHRRPPDPAVRNGRTFAVGYLGEMGDQDGIDHLIDAAAAVRSVRDDVQYVLIGDGPHHATLVEHAHRLGLDDCFTFTGRQVGADLCRLMSSLDIGVSPDPPTDWSDRSTLNKIVDYMFFGLPIVSYRLTESMVSAGDEAALFVDGVAPADLALGIRSLLDDPFERQRMGDAGARRVREHLTWEHSATVLIDAYRRLADTSDRQRG